MQEGINRLQFIDNMKTIGIIAVVVGHAPGLSKYFEAILYGFHVPLFFFVTGALLSNAKLSSSPKIFILRQARELLIPYLGFFLLSYGYWLLTRHHGNSSERFANTSWVDPLIGFASGKGSSILVNVVLWFFPALFSAKLIYFFVLKFLSKNAALFLLAIFAILYFFIQQFYNFRLWFGIDCAIYGVIFIAAGAISNRPFNKNTRKKQKFFSHNTTNTHLFGIGINQRQSRLK
jgi:acyltransferase